MAIPSGISFPKDKEYLYTFALKQNKILSHYVLDLIEADYNKKNNVPTIDKAQALKSISVIEKELASLRNSLK